MSAIAEHWEQTIKERLITAAMIRGNDDDRRDQLLSHDLQTLNDLLHHARMEAWQDGHDTALLNGQTSNPYKLDRSQDEPE